MKKIIITESQLLRLVKKNSSGGGHYKGNQFVPNWSEEQNLIAYYCRRFGPNKLSIGPRYNQEEQLSEIANYYIGTTVASLKMQMSNFAYLAGKEGLTDYSDLQEMIHKKYENSSEEEVRNLVLSYLDTINTEEVFSTFIKKWNEDIKNKTKAEIEKKLKLSQKAADEYSDNQLRGKGLNPSTSISLGDAKRNVIDYLESHLDDVFSALFGEKLVRVFEKNPEGDNTTFSGKKFNDAPDINDKNFEKMTGRDILDLISNDPVKAVLDHGIYESKNNKKKTITLTESQLKTVIEKIINDQGDK